MTTSKFRIGFILIGILTYACCSAYAGEFFCDGMDHFKTESDCNQVQKTEKAKQSTYAVTPKDVEMWGEPSVDADGKVVSKVPPAPVMRLLKEPTPENAQAYLDWNKQKVDAIQAAQMAVSSLDGKPNTAAIIIDDPQKIRSVKFFFGPTCPYSMHQVPVMEQLAKKVGWSKVTSIPTSTDVSLIRDFITKTGMNLKLSLDAAPVQANNITAVPVTIIDYAGTMLRFDGYTEDFLRPGATANQQSQSQCNQQH